MEYMKKKKKKMLDILYSCILRRANRLVAPSIESFGTLGYSASNDKRKAVQEVQEEEQRSSTA